MKLGDSIRSGVAWILAGNTACQILSIGSGIVLARLLAPAVFGMLVTIQIFTGLAGFIAGGGMGTALVRADEAGKRDYDVVFTLQLIIGCAIYAGFFVAAPWIAAWYKTPLYSDLLRISALSFVVRPFVNLPNNILYRETRYRAQTGVRLISIFVSGTVSISMAFFGYGVWSLIVGGLAGALTSATVLVPVARWRPGFSFELRRGRDLVRYGFLTTTGDFIVYLRNEAGNFVLSKTLGSHVLGLFNKAYSLSRIPHSQITSSVYQVTFRALAKEQGNLDLSRYLYLRSITLVSVYTWPAFLTLAWLALPLLRFVYGDKWVAATAPLTCFALVGPFSMLNMLAGSVLAARNWLDREIPVQISQLIIVVLGVVAGLPHGLVGVAIGASVAIIYGGLHMSWLAARCLSMPMRRVLSAIWTPLALNAPVLLLWFAIDHLYTPLSRYSGFLYLIIMLGSGGLLYGLLFFLAPIPEIASEKQRWLRLLKNSFTRTGRSRA